jgi:hypothetical protein
MNSKTLTELKQNDLLRKRLAKWMAYFCFRDTKLEQFHNRFTDDDMKELMIDCADHCYALVCMLFATKGGNGLIESLKEHDRHDDILTPCPTDVGEGRRPSGVRRINCRSVGQPFLPFIRNQKARGHWATTAATAPSAHPAEWCSLI